MGELKRYIEELVRARLVRRHKIRCLSKGVTLAVNEGYSLVTELELEDQSLGYAVVDFSLLRRDHDADKLSAAHRAYVDSPEPWQVCVWPVVTKEEESKVLR